MVWNKTKKFFHMVDFGHSLFGLPFAYLGAIFAAQGIPQLEQLLWITLAMVSARTAALCLNRVIDRKIDRANPRTTQWPMAAGEFSTGVIWILVMVFFGLLFFAASKLNPLCVKLAPLALVVLWGYSYTKRFTWWCHLILGLAIGIGPVGGWIAVSGHFDPQPLLLWLAVACWVAGFDTMYACQDIQFDRKYGLFSIPARFGEKGALWFSAGFHLLSICFLLLTGMVLNLGFWYYVGVGFTALLLVYEHYIVRPGDMSRVNFASFKINHFVGLIILIMSLIDISMK